MLTHGYVHGHIHQHKDHVHIHGHIHNHDHEQAAHDADTCGELKAEPCDDILCDELDDCYFDCADSGLAELEDGSCCEDPACLQEPEAVCTDVACMANEHHGNSLCEWQRPKMLIFENLLHNVLRNIEYIGRDIKEPEVKVEPVKDEPEPFQIHFPHLCHQEVPPLASQQTHSTHQSCFHAKIPSAETPYDENYNFLLHFNNYPMRDKIEPALEPVGPALGLEPTLDPLGVRECQWDACFKKISDLSLVDHLVDDHVRNEYRLGAGEPHPAFECEWSRCNVVESDFEAFLAHLCSHKAPEQHPAAATMSPLLTPISEVTQLPRADAKSPRRRELGDLAQSVNITEMRIQPLAGPDASFTCKWQVGTTPAGEPVLCHSTHDSAGHLQQHLQDEHIGHGKSIYHCCWSGCCRNKGKPFIQRQKLFRHIHIHTGYKPCQCNECGALFATPAMLAQHRRTHSGEKPYACKTCGKKFTTSSSLSIHNRVHSGDRPLKCTWPGCGKSFRESSNLGKHMRLHTKMHKCSICGEIFLQKKDYTKHRKIHDTDDVVLPEGISL